ncbi:MAG TPA: molybdenum cofactor guanylyltransferase MobA [Acidisphaera sp.]|nr:molybdenum cofactor guanylyltransferase MobA [Acidisphaera sp.]
MATPGVILAGGAARRMGGVDKALLPLGGRKLLAHVIARLAPQVSVLAVNANGEPARFAAFGLPVIGDNVPDRPGPLAGVLAAMEWAAAAGAVRVLTVPADAPFLPADLASRFDLALAGREAIAIAASGGRTHFVAASWPVALASDLRAALGRGERKVETFQDRYTRVMASWDVANGDPFFNVNTPDDLRTAAARLGVR